MKITYIGHSCFKIESENYSLVIDPYKDSSVPGLLPVRESANKVLASHDHFDHNDFSCVKIEDAKAKALTIEKIASYHDEVKGAKRGLNTIHLISDGKVKIAHLGDLGCSLTEEQEKLLQGLDALLIPVGGFYTINAEEAFEIVEKINPKVVIPMHYRSENFGFDVLDPCNAFTKHCSNVKEYGSEFILDENTHPQTALLTPKNSVK